MNGLTCNMKSSGNYKRWKDVNEPCIADQNHERSVVFLDYWFDSRDNIENEEGKGNYCSKLKKGKLKTKKNC